MIEDMFMKASIYIFGLFSIIFLVFFFYDFFNYVKNKQKGGNFSFGSKVFSFIIGFIAFLSSVIGIVDSKLFYGIIPKYFITTTSSACIIIIAYWIKINWNYIRNTNTFKTRAFANFATFPGICIEHAIVFMVSVAFSAIFLYYISLPESYSISLDVKSNNSQRYYNKDDLEFRKFSIDMNKKTTVQEFDDSYGFKIKIINNEPFSIEASISTNISTFSKDSVDGGRNVSKIDMDIRKKYDGIFSSQNYTATIPPYSSDYIYIYKTKLNFPNFIGKPTQLKYIYYPLFHVSNSQLRYDESDDPGISFDGFEQDNSGLYVQSQFKVEDIKLRFGLFSTSELSVRKRDNIMDTDTYSISTSMMVNPSMVTDGEDYFISLGTFYQEVSLGEIVSIVRNEKIFEENIDMKKNILSFDSGHVGFFGDNFISLKQISMDIRNNIPEDRLKFFKKSGSFLRKGVTLMVDDAKFYGKQWRVFKEKGPSFHMQRIDDRE